MWLEKNKEKPAHPQWILSSPHPVRDGRIGAAAVAC
jgi:hypothetical protein